MPTSLRNRFFGGPDNFRDRDRCYQFGDHVAGIRHGVAAWIALLSIATVGLGLSAFRAIVEPNERMAAAEIANDGGSVAPGSRENVALVIGVLPDAEMVYGSEDPADPSKTTRVLTIMLAEED